MTADIPLTKWERGVSGGKTAARMSRKVLVYLARSPFLTEEKRLAARKTMKRETAEVLFEGLSLLRGTALKAAQLCSMEFDLFPPEVMEELKKSSHEVPPLNRALARKVVQNALGRPPEEVFRTFDSQAFAAASLGQVHRATTKEGETLAVKIQYPGIGETIQSDMQLMRSILRAMPDHRFMEPAMAEIETRLLEETDYRRELENMVFFRERLGLDRVVVPAARADLSAATVLAAEHLSGLPLNTWLKTGPDRQARDTVAQTLQDLFVAGLYRLRCIHADPNPGNFLVREDATIGLVDFGCVKRFDPEFVALYAKLPTVAMHEARDDCLSLLRALGITKPSLDKPAQDRVFEMFHETSQWLSRLCARDVFDFSANPDFIATGSRLMRQSLELQEHMDTNTDFVFLHRTRYGMLRLFEAMGARVCFRNAYEW
ncbi:MAG: ABC1 kinase family protein [Solidesulfovibrio sp.]